MTQSNLPKLLPKRLEDELYGQYDNRLTNLDELQKLGMVSDEFRDSALAYVDAAWSHLAAVNANSMALGRKTLDEAIDAFIHEVSAYDTLLMSMLSASRFTTLTASGEAHGRS